MISTGVLDPLEFLWIVEVIQCSSSELPRALPPSPSSSRAGFIEGNASSFPLFRGPQKGNVALLSIILITARISKGSGSDPYSRDPPSDITHA